MTIARTGISNYFPSSRGGRLDTTWAYERAWLLRRGRGLRRGGSLVGIDRLFQQEPPRMNSVEVAAREGLGAEAGEELGT